MGWEEAEEEDHFDFLHEHLFLLVFFSSSSFHFISLSPQKLLS